MIGCVAINSIVRFFLSNGSNQLVVSFALRFLNVPLCWANPCQNVNIARFTLWRTVRTELPFGRSSSLHRLYTRLSPMHGRWRALESHYKMQKSRLNDLSEDVVGLALSRHRQPEDLFVDCCLNDLSTIVSSPVDLFRQEMQPLPSKTAASGVGSTAS